MDEIESEAQSFIVRVWVEDRAEEAHPGLWRGHITHASSGKRSYLKNLDEICDFIAPYLEAMGIRLRRRSWIRSQFRHLLRWL